MLFYQVTKDAEMIKSNLNIPFLDMNVMIWI